MSTTTDVGVEEKNKEDVETTEKVKTMPPWKVLLINDDHTPFDHVVRTVFKLTPLNEQESFHKTLEAHESGLALLLTTHKEAAEMYQEQFASAHPSIQVDIEPA